MQQRRKLLIIITDFAINPIRCDDIMETLDIWAEKAIEDAIINIKERKLLGENKKSGYNLANWREDWLWMMDDESNFDYFCSLAGYNSEELRNETLRLAKARIEDGILESIEWEEAKYASHGLI